MKVTDVVNDWSYDDENPNPLTEATANPERIDPILEALGDYWHQFPDLRFGQLVDNLWSASTTHPGPDLFYIQDEVLFAGLAELADPTSGNARPGGEDE